MVTFWTYADKSGTTLTWKNIWALILENTLKFYNKQQDSVV